MNEHHIRIEADSVAKRYFPIQAESTVIHISDVALRAVIREVVKDMWEKAWQQGYWRGQDSGENKIAQKKDSHD